MSVVCRVCTYDDAHFTALIVKSTGHHGADCVVHHRHDVCLIVLKNKIMCNSKQNQIYGQHSQAGKFGLTDHFKQYTIIDGTFCLQKIAF